MIDRCSTRTRTADGGNKRCAIYARYSSDLQRPSSIEDQTRKCRQECQRHEGWIIAEEWIVSDEEVSGRSLAGRDAMGSLKRAAKGKPRPFDCVLVDDTSRFGRNLGDVLKLAEFFEHYGVSLHFVSPPLDSRDPNFYQLLVFKGMMDEQYSVDLGHKVRRGQEGRVLAGYNAGGPCYGYSNVPEMAADGKREIGVRLEIIPEQAAVVRRIFELYASGTSLDRLAKILREDGVPSPKPPRKNSIRGWSADGIAGILRNKKYIGINERGRTTDVRDPETGRTVTRAVPEKEWICKKNPEWRIVSDELWNRVQEQLAQKKKFGIPKQGGLSRTRRSEKYLFSGLMSCGVCKGPVNIVDGTAGGETVWYGCSAKRYKDACKNALRVKRDFLEEQLLAWLTRDLLTGDRLAVAVSSFQGKVHDRVSELQAEARKNAVDAPELRRRLAEEKQKVRNIKEYIASVGARASVDFLDDLKGLDASIKKIEELLARAKEPESMIEFAAEDLKEYVRCKLRDLQAVLTSSPQVGRQVLQKHIRKITLTPSEVDCRPALHVTVEFALADDGNSGVLLNGTLDAFMQQYGFSAITVTGLALDTSRVRRKPAPTLKQSADSSATTPAAADSSPANHRPPIEGDSESIKIAA